jgi:hypothetical protein
MYDVKNVDAFVEEARKGTGPALWCLFHYISGLGMTTIHDYHQRLQREFLELTPWEKANVLYRLSNDITKIATEQAQVASRQAREQEGK